MAARKKNETKTYRITVESNPTYCGVDAGSVAFANGEAIITDRRMAEWFREHEGYAVEEIGSEAAGDETAEN